jgi:hypothetical protein
MLNAMERRETRPLERIPAWLARASEPGFLLAWRDARVTRSNSARSVHVQGRIRFRFLAGRSQSVAGATATVSPAVRSAASYSIIFPARGLRVVWIDPDSGALPELFQLICSSSARYSNYLLRV